MSTFYNLLSTSGDTRKGVEEGTQAQKFLSENAGLVVKEKVVTRETIREISKAKLGVMKIYKGLLMAGFILQVFI